MIRLFKKEPKPSPLPTGVTQFHEWSDRIIARAGLTATPESQKFTLANLLINLPSNTAHIPDTYFVDSLLKAAANQVAEFIRQEIREAVKARLAREEQEKKEEQNKAAVTAPVGSDVLENQTVPIP